MPKLKSIQIFKVDNEEKLNEIIGNSKDAEESEDHLNLFLPYDVDANIKDTKNKTKLIITIKEELSEEDIVYLIESLSGLYKQYSDLEIEIIDLSDQQPTDAMSCYLKTDI